MAKGFIQEDIESNTRQIVIQIERQFDPYIEASTIRMALQNAAKEFAEKWVEENRDKIIERLNVDAITNMIMLEVANDIKKDARKDTQ